MCGWGGQGSPDGVVVYFEGEGRVCMCVCVYTECVVMEVIERLGGK